MKKLLLALALLSISVPVLAQNIQCPNQPLGSSTNACANTRFVIQNAGGAPGGSNTQVQYNNAGAFGGITGATTNGTALTLVAPVLGTPASGTLTNTTGFPTANLAGAGTGVLTFLATPSSANLRSALTDETGTGAAVFAGGDIAAATATTAALGTNTTQVATTAFVQNQSATASFRVTKGGTGQTGVADSTFTEVTWPTESYDVGGHFASNAWTPPAGKVSLKAFVSASGTIAAPGALVVLSIYKNGAAFANGGWFSGVNNATALITTDDIANGTDVYTTRLYIDVDSGTATINGSTHLSSFSGHWISP